MTDNNIKDMNLCGICNHEVPLDHAQMIRKEADGTFTSYHIAPCGSMKVKPCIDCGQHRLLCNECKEDGGSTE